MLDGITAFGLEAIRNSSDSSNCTIASNGRGGAANAVKGRQQQTRRSIIGKQVPVVSVNDAQAIAPTTSSQTNSTVSSIAQRPRRQVKHKFIKSANINLIEKSNEQSNVQKSDVAEQEQQQQQQPEQSLDSVMQILSPNCKVRLVPVIHRLSVNTGKLNWNDVISQTSTEQESICEASEYIDNVTGGDDNGNLRGSSSSSGSDGNGAIAANAIECEPITSVDKEMKTERHKKLSNSKQAIRRGRQLRQTVCPVEPAECENGTESAPPCTNDIEHSAPENNVEYSVLTSGNGRINLPCTYRFILDLTFHLFLFFFSQHSMMKKTTL